MIRYRPFVRSLLVLSVAAIASTHVPGATPLDDAVAARRAVERVYWTHRLWPEDNAQAKPRLESILPDAAVRARVEDAWRKSRALDTLWSRPLTDAALQAELDRMAASTRAPEVLQEIFDVLGNDPGRIVDAIVRPVLADRLVREAYGEEATFDAWWKSAREALDGSPATDAHRFTLPKIGDTPCTPLTWMPMCCGNGPPSGAARATVVWTGSEMIVWGGNREPSAPLGGRYDPATNAWTPMTAAGEPSLREGHATVWTGTEMIVWGGTTSSSDPTNAINSGGRYNPSTDTWTPTSVVAATPAARRYHTAVWTGSRMVVWGGSSGGSLPAYLNTGAQYDPATDSWVATAVTGQTPLAREIHTAVWTGTRMIVWGGSTIEGTYGSTGALYDPVANSWSATKPQGAPAARAGHSAVWSGTEMIVWGGWTTSGATTNSGGRYDPAQNKWTLTSTGTNVAAARGTHVAAWTGTRMLVWGGIDGSSELGSGARYDPSTDLWTSITMTGAPQARTAHVGVWTGSRFVVWGGWDLDAQGSPTRFDSGGRYDPVADAWTPTAANAADPKRSLSTATWTGSELIVFGGIDSPAVPTNIAAPRRYDPATDSWSSASSVQAPSARRGHTAVWTGTDVIVWGGFGATHLDDGARYDPSLDAWTPLPAAGAPSARTSHTAVWTGRRMVLWGGDCEPGHEHGRPLRSGRECVVTHVDRSQRPHGTVPAHVRLDRERDGHFRRHGWGQHGRALRPDPEHVARDVHRGRHGAATVIRRCGRERR
jgi:N-acetylneuraminic acid mutarotase